MHWSICECTCWLIPGWGNWHVSQTSFQALPMEIPPLWDREWLLLGIYLVISDLSGYQREEFSLCHDVQKIWQLHAVLQVRHSNCLFQFFSVLAWLWWVCHSNITWPPTSDSCFFTCREGGFTHYHLHLNTLTPSSPDPLTHCSHTVTNKEQKALSCLSTLNHYKAVLPAPWQISKQPN